VIPQDVLEDEAVACDPANRTRGPRAQGGTRPQDKEMKPTKHTLPFAGILLESGDLFVEPTTHSSAVMASDGRGESSPRGRYSGW
jgi:hypothetical protein